MQAVVTTYFVIAPLPIVVEDDGEALNYGPGATFQALSSNASIVRLLESDQIIEIPFTASIPGSTVIQGLQGPPGDPALTGWERVGAQVRLATDTDQVTMGLASPPADSKINIDASKGAFAIGLTIVSGTITVPGSGVASERYGEGTIATGACSLAIGFGAQALAANASAGGKGAIGSAVYGTAWGAGSSAGIDSTASGSGATADQSGSAYGRSSVATGLRSLAGGIGATNVGADSVLLGANGNIGADETIVVGAGGSATAVGAQAAGFSSAAGGVDASAWGRNSTSNFAGSHAWGANAITTAVRQFVFGSQSDPIEFYYFGRGESAISAQDVRLASTRIGTTQTDELGSNLILEAGPGTGNATPSEIYLQTAVIGVSGNAQQVLGTRMKVGVGVDITEWLNVGPTSAAASPGSVAATDGTSLFHWDSAAPQLNLGTEGLITRLRGIDSITGGVDGGSLYVVAGTGLTAGAGGSFLGRGGDSGASGLGGSSGLQGGTGITGGGPVTIIGGDAVGAPGGLTTLAGGVGAPAGALLAHGGITNGVGGQSGDGVFSGGDASAVAISLAGDGILKGGDGVSNNNHGADALIRGGLAFGGGINGLVQIETAGVGRWQVDNSGKLLAVSDTTYDIGAVAAGRPRDLFVGRNAVIDGHLTVNGGQTIINTEIQTADRYMLLNSEYTADAPLTSGFVFNVDPAATSFSISDITSDVITVVAGDPSAVLSAADFVLIQNPSNPDNVGLYEVLSATATTITIDPTPAEAFTGSGLTDDVTVQGVVVGTGVTVLRTSVTGDFEQAFGTSGPLIFSPVAGDLATVLTIGNTTGGTDIAITSGDQIGGGRANFGTATDAAADGDLAAGLVGGSRLAYTQATGGLFTFFANGESSALQYATAVVDFSVSGTVTGLIPAGALPVSVSTRVLTTISGGGAASYAVGDTGDGDRWGTGLALAAATTSDPTNFTDNTLSFNASASADDVVLSGVGGAPTAGTVRVTLAYLSFTAPTS